MPGVDIDDEITEFLKNWKTEDQLDIPTFLRRPLLNQRRLTTTQSTKKTTKTSAQQPLFR